MNKIQDQKPLDSGQTYIFRLPNTKLSKNNVIQEGFLCKGSMPIALVTSGIIVAATKGFLHVDEVQEYET